MKSKIISILALLLMAVTGARASPVQTSNNSMAKMHSQRKQL